jgi:vancomycin permeability regulator SanA
LLPGLGLLVIFASLSTYLVRQASQGKLYDDVDRIPARGVALLLGADKAAAPRIFANRIDAATSTSPRELLSRIKAVFFSRYE